jgi:hypothetical protein
LCLAIWICDGNDEEFDDGNRESEARLVYPQAAFRLPPTEGLESRELQLYEEASAVASVSARAACALLRVLLEALMKRYLVDEGHNVSGKRLDELINLSVSKLGLSQSLKSGLTAIRKRGNTAVHDPYGLTEDARSGDLPWLFQAVDDLVEDLHMKPKRWSAIARS